MVPDGAFVFPPNPHYGGTGAVAHVEAVPRLFASQQGYALPRPRNVEPPVLRTAPMGHGERFPRDPFCRRAPEKRKSHFPLTPITGEPALSRMLRLFLAFLRPNRAMRCRGRAMSNPQSSGQPLWGTGKGFPGTPSVAELQKNGSRISP